MLGLDGEKLAFWRRKSAEEAANDRRQKLLQQEIDSNTVTVKDDAGRNTASLFAAMGQPLTSEEVQRRLKLCCPALHFERSWRFPEKTGVYLLTKGITTTADGMNFAPEKKFLFGMETGILPEFSVRHQTTKRIPNKEIFGKPVGRDTVDWIEVPTFLDETRGWRTVLIRLLHCGLITRGQVEQHFGWAPSRDSANWSQLTK